MSSWNRRVAAASRVRDNLDPDAIDERLRALGLPRGLHPDDAIAVLALLRVAEGREGGFSSTVIARVLGENLNLERFKVLFYAVDDCLEALGIRVGG